MSHKAIKITRPKLVNVLERKKLYRLIDKGFKKPITWIIGPPGSGKTTLVASYLDSKRFPCIWYQIDEGDADIATFFYYMGLAARNAAPRKRKPLPLLTPEYYMGIPTFTRRYFEGLYSRVNPFSPSMPPHPSLPHKGGGTKRGVIGGKNKSGFVIVFDNYQKVPAESPFHEVIVNGLTEIPEGINAIVISRTEPPQTFARMRASNKMKTIDWKDLQLSEEETKGFVRRYCKLPRETIAYMHQQTQGWAAGIILMMERAKTEEISPQLLGKYTQKEIFEYFAEEIFKKLDRETNDFLLKTAFLPQMITPHIAEKLTNHDNAFYILSSLSNNHFFTERRSTIEDAYQYHPLFREFLLSKAKEIFTQAAVTEIKRKAAGLLEESNQIGDAAELYIEAGEWERLVGLILKHAQDMVMHGRNKTLDNWLSYMPQAIVFANPWLNYWLGVCRMPYSFRESRACFERAYEIFKEQKNAEGLFLSWFGVIDTYVHQMSDFNPLNHWISEIEKLLNEYPEFPSPEAEARVTAGIFYAMMYGQPQHPDFPLWEERLREILLTMKDVYFRTSMSNHLIIYYTWFSGEHAKGDMLIKNLRSTFSHLAETQPFAYIEFRSKEAAHLMMTGRNDLALEVLDNAFRTAEATGIHVWDFWLCVQGVNISLSEGDLKKARGFLEKIGQIVNPERCLETAYYYHQLAWELLCLGDPNAALEHARTGLKMGIESGVHFAQALLMTSLAEVLFELGRYDEAITYIEDAHAMGWRFKGQMIEYHALLVQTRIFLRMGKTGAALESLRGHLKIGRECGTYNNLIWRSSVMAEICSIALEEGIEKDYVQELIRRRGLVPESQTVQIENWPWPIKIYTLGRFGLLKDGKPVQFSGKAQKKPIEMLKALIAFGGREVSEERIIEALWPDAEGDVAHISFKTTLHRLRNLLKPPVNSPLDKGGHRGVRNGMGGLSGEDVITVHEGKVTLDQRYCWVDVWAFERLLSDAESRWSKKNKDEAVRLTEKAVAMYKGQFLSKESESRWSVSMQERLRGKFLRSMIRLGNHCEGSGQMERAIEFYQKGLEIDDLAEEMYQKLMNCYLKLGNKAEAVKVYNRCKKILAATLGVEPSPETEAIYQSLIA